MAMTNEEIAWLKAIGKRIKIARVEHDLSQDDLARRASLTRNQVSAIERSAQQLKLYEINRIAGAFGADLADFIGGAS